MSVDRVDNIKDAPEKALSRVIGHASDGKGGAATLENLKEQLAITSADVAGAVPDTREVATEGGIQGGGPLGGDLTLSLTDTAVAADTYGSASAVPVITVDAKGRVTAAEEVEVEVPTSGVVADTYGSATAVAVVTVGADGRITDAENVAIEVPASGVVADTYGSATDAPVLTIGADGRVTGATTAKTAGKRTITIRPNQMTPAGAASGSVAAEAGVSFPSIDFDASALEYVSFLVPMPKSWDGGTVSCKIGWAPSNTGSGDVYWLARTGIAKPVDSTDNLAGYGSFATIASAAPGAVDRLQVATIGAITPDGTAAADALLRMQVVRNGGAGADTYAADAKLMYVQVIYTEDAATDD